MKVLLDETTPLTAAWLEETLKRSGALQPDGTVEAIEVELVADRRWSQMHRISARYRNAGPGAPPERLLLKQCAPNGQDFDDAEVNYYTRDYAGLRDAPIPRCFGAAFVAAPRRYHLLLEDLSATHANFDGRQPDAAYAQALGKALAVLHAHLHGEQRWTRVGGRVPEQADFERYVGPVRAGLEPLIRAGSSCGVDAGWAARLRGVIERLPERFAARARRADDLVQIHGDPNPGNILVPHAGTAPLYLVDRQPFDWSLRIWLGASDLAYAMVLWWDTDARRRLELDALRAYAVALRAQGVPQASFARVFEDYRLCIVEALGVAIQWCGRDDDRERMEWLWRMQLRRAMLAYEDLRCNELWS